MVSFLESIFKSVFPISLQVLLVSAVLFVGLILFVLVFLLYRANKESAAKILELESLLGATANRVLSMKEKTHALTYQDVVNRFSVGQTPEQIAKEVDVSVEELEALERVLKSVQ